MLFTHLLRVRDVFNIDVFVVIVLFFLPPYTLCYCFTYFPSRNFVLFVGSRQTKNLFDLRFVIFLSFDSCIFCQFCMDVAVAFPLGHSFIIRFSVAIYSHANECSVRFTVFESTMICCDFFLS